jgi:hypothetical protein
LALDVVKPAEVQSSENLIIKGTSFWMKTVNVQPGGQILFVGGLGIWAVNNIIFSETKS